MSPCLLLYALAAVVGAVLGGPSGLLAAALLVAVVAARHRLAHPTPAVQAVPAVPPAPAPLSRAAAGGAG